MLAKILGVSVAGYTMQEAIDFLLKRLLNQQKSFVVTANAEIIMLAQHDNDFKRIITEEADLVLPDGQMNKYIRGIMAFFVVLVMISPLANIITNGIDTSFFYDNKIFGGKLSG